MAFQGSGDMDTVTRASSIISISDHPDLEEVEEGNTDAEEDRGAEKGVLTRDVLANMGVPLVGVGLDGKPVKRFVLRKLWLSLFVS